MHYTIILIYALIIFVLDEYFSFLTQWTQLLFELFFVMGTIIYFRLKNISQNLIGNITTHDILWFLANLILGGLIYQASGWLNTQVPFDFSRKQTYLWLVFIGPIIEELIFRHSLYIPLKIILKKSKWIAIIITSAIFSYAHGRVLFDLLAVPLAIKYFVIYQCLYTFILGLLWGYLREKRNSLVLAIIMHMGFNLGFAIMGYFVNSH